jgi:RNA polymerase sigma-70 factor, ECF subfamily
MARAHRLVETDVIAALPRLRRYARVLSGDSHVADDLVAQTLARAWKSQRSWPPETNLRTWLFSLMHDLWQRNEVHHREPGKTRTTLDVGAEPETLETPAPAAGSPQPAAETPHVEAADMRAQLARLPVEEREVLMLVAIERLPYGEVASLLDVPMATVMSTLTRARKRMCAIR